MSSVGAPVPILAVSLPRNRTIRSQETRNRGTSIGDGVCMGCTSLSRIRFYEDNVWYERDHWCITWKENLFIEDSHMEAFLSFGCRVGSWLLSFIPIWLWPSSIVKHCIRCTWAWDRACLFFALDVDRFKWDIILKSSLFVTLIYSIGLFSFKLWSVWSWIAGTYYISSWSKIQ